MKTTCLEAYDLDKYQCCYVVISIFSKNPSHLFERKSHTIPITRNARDPCCWIWEKPKSQLQFMFSFLLWILLTTAVVVWNLELLYWWGFGTSEQKVSAGCLGRYREYLCARQNRSMSYKFPMSWMKSFPCLIRCSWLWYLFLLTAGRLEQDNF